MNAEEQLEIAHRYRQLEKGLVGRLRRLAASRARAAAARAA
jgi:hypothetical protein